MNRVEVERFETNPIVHSGLGDVGQNINGPSLIRVPDWVDRKLSEYYLYFASHRGQYIRLAHSDDLAGPWTVHEGGVLHIDETPFPSATVTSSVRDRSRLLALTKPFHSFGKGVLERLSRFSSMSPRLQTGTPHIASPDVNVDDTDEEILLYYHGCCGKYTEDGEEMSQFTRAACSKDGLDFETREEKLGRFYFRVFEYDDTYYALAKENSPGDQTESGFAVYESNHRLSGFSKRTTLLNDGTRHPAVRVKDRTLQIFYSRIGDCPERIFYTEVDLQDDPEYWAADDPVTVLEPTEDYEGGDQPLEPSVSGPVDRRVRQLRDPALYEENDSLYLLYSVAGESGIAIARVVDERIV